MGQTKAFGYKTAWLAVRDVDPVALGAALEVQERSGCSWPAGIDAIYESDAMSPREPVFITPRLGEWVLAVSPVFLNRASDADPEQISNLVTELSERLHTEVQFFATHRVVEGHAWALAKNGQLHRAFFYLGEVGEVLLDRLKPTAVEANLGLNFSDLSDEEQAPDEHTVMSVAAGWSIDPTSIEEQFADAEDGSLGTLGNAAHAGVNIAPDTGGGESPWWKFW